MKIIVFVSIIFTSLISYGYDVAYSGHMFVDGPVYLTNNATIKLNKANVLNLNSKQSTSATLLPTEKPPIKNSFILKEPIIADDLISTINAPIKINIKKTVPSIVGNNEINIKIKNKKY